jgi:hypothetical protein
MREDELVGKLDRRYRLVMEASGKAEEGQPAPTDFRIPSGHWDSEEKKDEIPNPQMPFDQGKTLCGPEGNRTPDLTRARRAAGE